MSRPAPLFTVLLPVHRSPELLPFAIRSVLGQTEADLELFVLCDGAPRETADCARGFAEQDGRVTVLELPKGERHGEAHRHTALESARGRFVAQLGDDDLWFPGYLAELALLLENVHFGNLVQVEIEPDGQVRAWPGDLADLATRERMLTTTTANFFSPTFAGYWLAAYWGLRNGWTPAPPGVQTDLHMWRKFLSTPGLRFGTRFAVEGVKLSAETRAAAAGRIEETRAVAEQIADERGRADLRERALRDLHAGLSAAVASARETSGTAHERWRAAEEDKAALESALTTARQRNRRLRERRDVLGADRRRLHHRLRDLEGSTSWRLTAPLRLVGSRVRRLRLTRGRT